MPTSSYYRTITTLLFIKPPKRKRRKVLKQLNVGDFQMPLEQWLVISYLLWCSFSSLMFSWELDFVILLLLSRYLFCCSYSHNVAPKGKFIAFVSTEAETDHPGTELKAGIDLLGPVDEIFFDIYDRYEPVNEPTLDNCFISTVSWYPQFYIVAFTNWCKLNKSDHHVCRVMMQQHTLSQLSWTYSTCIPW